jgi:hypothetical protein
MDYLSILSGQAEALDVYGSIARCCAEIELLPELLEPIYREAMALADEETDRLRFALVRLQVHADIHRYEDMEESQKVKYVAQVLEKVIFGDLMLAWEPGHTG